jgi:hypothetical protein
VRRYRVMEPLEGESLEQALEGGARLAPREAVEVLTSVARVLAATHSWAVTHGCLGPSSVFRASGATKLIDFGLTKGRPTPADDLRAVGALGFALLNGQELEDGVPPASAGALPAPLDRLLRDLVAGHVASAGKAVEALEALGSALPVPAVQPPRRRPLFWVVGACAGLALFGAVSMLGLGGWPISPEPSAIDDVPRRDDAANEDEALDELFDEPTDQTPARPPAAKSPRKSRQVPSARALNEEISRLEMRLRKEVRSGADFDQGMFVLNKQRLQLAGSPTLDDRAEVARRLRAWRLNYLPR